MKRILMVAAATFLAGCPSYPPQQPGTQPQLCQ